MTNSRQKGKRGERDAAKFLQTLGFTDARRTAQVRGKNNGAPDVESDLLPNLHIEVKTRESLDLGTSALDDAWEQAVDEAADRGRLPVLLWKRNRSCWRLTCREGGGYGHTATYCGDEAIGVKLQRVNDVLPAPHPMVRP